MIFTEPAFLFLLFPLACFLFYTITPRKGPSAGLAVLLVISLLFYLPWGWEYFFLLIVSITVNYIAAYFLLVIPDPLARQRKAALALGLSYNFLYLFWFKYRLSLLQGLSLSAPTGNFSVFDVAIPIGISFYTFQQATFLLDAFHREPSVVAFLGNLRAPWGKLRGFIHHAFFVSFFPHLVIGPIVYMKEFQPQVESKQFGHPKVRDLEVGLTIIAIGLFKKVVIADNLAPTVDAVFGYVDRGVAVSSTLAWLGVLGYYVQLYFDFSGYSDMAIGTARVLGVRFPINFFSPLKAVGIIDYYRRWHITLTRVIARFLYMPLSMAGARIAARRRWGKTATRAIAQWLPLLLNFEVIALWHGARFTFVVFGLVSGIWYVLETEVRASKTFKALKKRIPDAGRAAIGRVLFTFPMMLTFALFRSTSVESYWRLLTEMFQSWPRLADLPAPGDLVLGPVGSNWEFLVAAYAIVWLMPNAIELTRHYRPGIKTYENEYYGLQFLRFAWRPNLLWTIVVAGICLFSVRYFDRQPPFLYMGF